MAHFYVGGKYVASRQEQMSGAMYVEVWVPNRFAGRTPS